jgi:hypothetical protein
MPGFPPEMNLRGIKYFEVEIVYETGSARKL